MSAVIRVHKNSTSFECFGSECAVIVSDARRPGDAADAVSASRRQLLAWHEQFSRFLPDSELSRLNADPRPTVTVGPVMRKLLEAAVDAARETGGLVDATLGAEIEASGYTGHFEGDGLPLEVALALAPPRRPATGPAAPRVLPIALDRRAGTVTRPPGLRIDLGGIAKGAFADQLATMLGRFDAFAIDCGGDLRLGGELGLERSVHVASPFDGSILHTFSLCGGGVATSGIGRRSWLGPDGHPAHHLLDPGTGRAAFTGVVQATALAPTAAEAEVLSKAAVLSGPDAACDWLPHGGAVVLEDSELIVVEPVLDGRP